MIACLSCVIDQCCFKKVKHTVADYDYSKSDLTVVVLWEEYPDSILT